MEDEVLQQRQSDDDESIYRASESPSAHHPRRPVLRVMCLHDAHSHALELKESLTTLGERLYKSHGIDLVYVNSPLAVLDRVSPKTRRGRESDGTSPGREPMRVWWHENDGAGGHLPTESHGNGAVENPDGSHLPESPPSPQSPPPPHSPTTYLGLDASLLHLQQVWTAGPPFWGVFGVGQGGAVASVFSLLPTTYPPPQCLVFCDVTQALLGLDGEADNGSGPLSMIPTLHVGFSHPRLVAQFPCGGCVTVPSDCGRSALLNAVGRFLVGRRRAMMAGDDQGDRVLALQTALHAVQLRASELLAQDIADNPPAALMAVIHPQHVAGWKGNKRRQPGEEGGGAPCPPEFLLHREHRGSAKPGASRAHPHSATAG